MSRHFFIEICPEKRRVRQKMTFQKQKSSYFCGVKVKVQLFFILLMAVCVLFQAVSKTVVAAYWTINRVSIAKNLCEKRFEKKSCCEGACQLKKWTNDENKDKSDATPISTLKNLKEVDCFFENSSENEFSFVFLLDFRQAILGSNDRLPRCPNLDFAGKPPQA
jgi:hypothetical protein